MYHPSLTYIAADRRISTTLAYHIQTSEALCETSPIYPMTALSQFGEDLGPVRTALRKPETLAVSPGVAP